MNATQAQALFAALAAILVLASGAGWIARCLGQPTVIGEIAVGVLVGPTVLGGVLTERLLPTEARPLLAGLASIGLAGFLYTIGRDLNLAHLRGQRRAVLGVALGSAALPFVLGAALAVALTGRHPTTNSAGSAVFLGVAMSVSALPVLARMLDEHRLRGSADGALALAAAAVIDAAAWIALAATIVAVSSARDAQSLLFAPLYLSVMLFLVRPALRVLHGHRMRPVLRVTTLIALCASCWAAEHAGLHYAFGAFLLGTITPKDPQPPNEGSDTRAPLEHASRTLLPMYFFLAGAGVDLSGLDWTRLGEMALILAVAAIGKLAGTYLGARVTGLGHHRATTLAILMNTRGLTEIIVLTIGLQTGLIDTGLYAAMIFMALATTAATGPAMRLAQRHQEIR